MKISRDVLKQLEEQKSKIEEKLKVLNEGTVQSEELPEGGLKKDEIAYGEAGDLKMKPEYIGKEVVVLDSPKLKNSDAVGKGGKLTGIVYELKGHYYIDVDFNGKLKTGEVGNFQWRDNQLSEGVKNRWKLLSGISKKND